MKIVGLMPVRNEAWCLGLTLRAALLWMDAVIVGLHACTDASPEIVAEIAEQYPNRIGIVIEPDPVWEEMKHRQRLLELAREQGATHIATIDADELVSGDLLASMGFDPVGRPADRLILDKTDSRSAPVVKEPRIRRMVEAVPDGSILQLPWLALRGSIDRVVTSGPWAEGQNVSIAFKDSAEWHWSASGRVGKDRGYDHHQRHPMGRAYKPERPIAGRSSGLLHLQFVSERRLKAKQLAYCLVEKLRWPGREPVSAIRDRYGLAVYGEGLSVAVPESWWRPYRDLLPHLHVDAEPWQLDYCREMIKQHPGILEGLDDFGLFTTTAESGSSTS